MDSARHDRLRLLVAVPFTPRVDAPHGGRVIAQFLLELSTRHRVALVYLRRKGTETIDASLAERCELVEEVEPSSILSGDGPWQRRLRVLVSPLSGLPSPIRASYDRRLGEALGRVAQSWRPDVIQLEHEALAHCAQAIRPLARAVILVCHEPGLEAARELARTSEGRRRWAHRLDAWVWRRYWKKHLPNFDAVVVFTDDDRRALAAAADGIRVDTIPLGIEIPEQPLDPRGSDSTIAYVGGYQHLPNADAAIRLMRSIAPRVREHVPSLRVSIVGAAPTAEMRLAASAQDDVTGAVPSVVPYVNDAAVVVLPIRLGGGMRVKLLEALAAGKAIVASPRAAAGIAVNPGVELELAETDDEFVHTVVALLRDDARRVALAENARAWAVEHLGWSETVRSYEDLYRLLLSSDA
jgi:glycosyltransferase involved in cell wall biosynthesis